MKTHRTDLVSLIPGLAFVTLAVAALGGAVEIDLVRDLRWVWPALAITVGVLLLAGASRDRRTGTATTTSEEPAPAWVDDPTGDPTADPTGDTTSGTTSDTTDPDPTGL